MIKTIFLIDGFNLYHSLNNNNYNKYKWLNIKKLCECFLTSKEEIVSIKYFSAYAYWLSNKQQRHEHYIRALQSTGIEIIMGKFKVKERFCLNCYRLYLSHEEKRTDVNMAIHLLLDAMNNKCDTFVIVSGDSDLIPAVQATKLHFPTKRIGVLIPVGRSANELKQVADFSKKIKESNLRASQFDNIVDIGNNIKLQRPANWI